VREGSGSSTSNSVVVNNSTGGGREIVRKDTVGYVHMGILMVEVNGTSITITRGTRRAPTGHLQVF
jgi:hypothetical protein